MKRYHRTIFFTKSPLNGYYRFEDVFQIFPATLENMPASNTFRKFHFPNILEYWTSEDEHVTTPSDLEGLEELHILTARMSRKETQILGLLSSFSNNVFFTYSAADGSWGLPMPQGLTDDEINALSSVWCFHKYFFPGLPDQLRIDGFTEYPGDLIRRVEHFEFYTSYPNLDSDRNSPVLLPDTIDNLIQAYYSLSPDIMNSVDYAISYTVSAISLHHTNKTLSLLASFTSLETLVDLEYRDQKVESCPTCNQPRFKVSAKFSGFLLKYIGDTPANKKKFNKYYSFRSKVIHTGRQLATEKLFAEVPEAVASEELLTRTEILQLGKVAIANWLLRHE